VLQSS